MKRPLRACRRDLVVIEQEPARRQRRLLQSHLRPGGETNAHSCPVCLVGLRINPDQLRPAWQQCPTCRVVMHESCLYSHMMRYEDEFPCPNCRTLYAIDAVENDDQWNADDAIDALLDEDVDYILCATGAPAPEISAATKRRSARLESAA